ncbi:MAG: BamA/TamA family outer membrane protein [Myxococcota bacterium]|nr:BamA/TamA family outer membrane protein [Myxococcota bacterium]
MMALLWTGLWVLTAHAQVPSASPMDADAARTAKTDEPIRPIPREDSAMARFWARTKMVPLVLYSPETSVMIGLGTLTLSDVEAGSDERPSSLSLFGIYTLENQSVLLAAYELRSKRDTHIIQQVFRYVDWPDQFYGIGNANNKGISIEDNAGGTRDYIKLKDAYFQIESDYLYRMLGRIYVGLSHHFRFSRTPGIESAAEDYGFLSTRGVGTSIWSGLAPVLLYDDRDQIVWPRSGHFIRYDTFRYSDLLGSDYRFSVHRFDARLYRTFLKGHTVALRSVIQRATGEVPFQRLPSLGGPDLFRGWYIGRLRDRALHCNQLEYRIELTQHFAAVGFFEFARVAPSLSTLHLDGYRGAGGAGFRYALDQSQRANLRLDIAYGAQFEFYFQFKEAF